MTDAREPHLLQPIETERLILRRMRAGDLDDFLAYRNDPQVQEFDGMSGLSREEGERFIEGQTDRLIGVPGQWLQIVIELKETGSVIGDLGFRIDGDLPFTAEIGYRLGLPYQRQGYATEAARALLGYAFGVLRLHRIEAYVDCNNRDSIALLERLRFRREAHFVESYPSENGWTDEYLYALLEREWEAMQVHTPAG